MSEQLIESFKNITGISIDKRQDTAMDNNHALLIYSLIISHKPSKIVELGVGTGLISKAIYYAIKYNRIGESLHIDYPDLWKPAYGTIESLKEFLAPEQINILREEEFVSAAKPNSCDFLISDADHYGAHQWVDKVCDIVSPGGVIVFHDVTHPTYPNLQSVTAQIKEMKLPYFLFNKNSRENEYCDRGLLVVNNLK